MDAHAIEREPSPPAPNAPGRPGDRRRTPRWLPAIAFGMLLVGGLVPIAAAAPAGPTPIPTGALPTADAAVPASNSSAPSGVWAWGAVANLSIAATFVGAYNASQSLSGGNLTNSGAAIAVTERAEIRYAVYAIVNVSTPSAGHLRVDVEAAQYRGEALAVNAAGTFPVAGTYAANATPPLTPMNVSLAARVQSLVAYRAFLNFTTGSNGSLSLADEHVESLRAVNLSLIAVNFPNVTRLGSGGERVSYATGSIRAAGYVAESLRASFAPAVPVVLGPLYVGKSWTAASNVSLQGWASYAEAIHATSGGTSASSTKSGGTSLNATASVLLTFRVTGTRTIYLPDGSSEVDYVIAYRDASGSGGVLLANGLIVLPAKDPTGSAGLVAQVPEHAATAPLASAVPAQGSALYSTRHQMIDGEQATPTGASAVTAAPETAAQATAAIRALGQPAPPSALGAGPSGSPLMVPAVYLAGGAFTAIGLLGAARRGGIRRR